MNLQGTMWRFKKQLEMPQETISVENPSQEQLFGRNLFSTNGEAYKKLSARTMVLYSNGSDTIDMNYVYNTMDDHTWTNEAYRTVSFFSNAEFSFTPNEETFMNWLNSNATQISQDDLPKYIVPGAKIREVADVIRMKTHSSAGLTFPSGFVTAIDSIALPPISYKHSPPLQ